MNNNIKLYDRLSKQIKELKLNQTINVYVCGPTVYDHAHIGHGRSLIVFDILNRLLSYQTNVVFVQNITDIADQILQKATNEQKSEQEIIAFYTQSYNNMCKTLNIKEFSHQPKPTEYLNEMIDYIQILLNNNNAEIRENDGIYIKLDDNYGRFNQCCDLKPFALWMFKDNYGFNSPWGKGRPGWHLECSVMSQQLFGDKFHIHGGGSDLVFPHHENEIAQSIAHSNCIPAEIWMHNNMININGEKMSKSLGNFKYLHDIINNSLDADKLKLLVLSYNYDSIIEIDDNIWQKVSNTLQNWRSKLFQHKAIVLSHPSEKLIKILNDNLNTSDALQFINKLILNEKCDQALTDLRFLGFIMEPITKISNSEIEALVEKRNEAKKHHNFKLADQIRNQLINNNINLIDKNSNTTWHYL